MCCLVPLPCTDTVVRAVLLGTGSPTRANSNVSRAVPQPWHERPRIVTDTDSTEEWDIINLTVDAHPIHIHVSDFQVRFFVCIGSRLAALQLQDSGCCCLLGLLVASCKHSGIMLRLTLCCK